MGVQIREFVQHEFLHSGVSRYANTGDFFSFGNLRGDANFNRLIPGPKFSDDIYGFSSTQRAVDHVEKPGAFFNTDQGAFCFVTRKPSDGHLYISCTTFSIGFTATDTGITAVGLGGLVHRNIEYHGGQVYLILDGGKVYGGAVGVLSELYSGADAQILGVLNDQLYMVTTSGVVYTLDDDEAGFTAYFAPSVPMYPLFIGPFRSYLLYVTHNSQGEVSLHRLSDNGLVHLAKVQGTGAFPLYGNVFHVHNDLFYFSSGWERYIDDYHCYVPFYEFNGSRARLITTRVLYANWAYGFPHYFSLHSWRGHLLLSSLAYGQGYTHYILQLVGEYFTGLSTSTINTTDLVPFLACLGGELLLLERGASTTDGVRHTYTTGFSSDSMEFISSWLDMCAPDLPKRLHGITVMLDDFDDDYGISVYYRIDDGQSWTSAVVGESGARYVRITELSVSFYTIQIRIVALNDTDTVDVGMTGFSLQYSQEV